MVSELIKNELEQQIVETLMEFPFNVSQKGFPLLVKCIEKQLLGRDNIRNLSKNTIGEVAEENNITPALLEKTMRETISTANVNCLNSSDLVYPNYLIKSAFRDTRVKSFIAAMSVYILSKQSFT